MAGKPVDEDEIISGLRASLVSVQGRRDLKQISDDFYMLMGFRIPYSQLGYRSLEQFILSIPSLTTSYVNGQLLVDAKPSQKNVHIASLVDKQKSSKRKPRYTSRSNFNHHAVAKWRPKDSDRNWKRYQSSPRPAAVSHNQFVAIRSIPSTSSSSNLPPRLSNRLTVTKEVVQPQVPPTREEPTSVKIETKLTENDSSFFTKAKKRITVKMAGITIKNNVRSNGTTEVMETFPTVRSSVDWNSSIAVPHSTPVLPLSEIQKLRHESLAAVDLHDPVWTWSSSEEGSETFNVKSTKPPKTEDNNLDTIMEFTGDPVVDLRMLAVVHKLGEPQIKIISRMEKLDKIKVTVYDCHIKVGAHSYSSYPNECHDEASAKRIAAKSALDDLASKYNRRQSLLISDDKDILERIPPIVKSHYSGLWDWQLEQDYVETFKEQLPVNWLEIVDTIPCITVLPLIHKRFVLRYCKPGEKGNNFIAPLISHVSVPSNTVKFNDDGLLLAEITCLASAGEIWCRQINTAECDAFDELTNKLEQYYRGYGKNEKANQIEVGGYYVACYENMWCRVRVFEINGNDVNCFCIDFGDEWVLRKDEIYQLHRQFARVHAQAFVCRLAGVEELYEASKTSDYFNSLVGKVVQVQLSSVNDDAAKASPTDPALSVILYDTEKAVAINQQLIYFIGIESAVPTLSKTSPTKVYVTHVMDDGFLYVQVPSLGYDHLMKMLEELEKSLVENRLELPKEPITCENSKDRLYFTQYDKDGHWYRSKMIDWSPNNNYAQILFVDCGKTTIVRVDKQLFYPLEEYSDVIHQFPYQAIKVRMNIKGVPSDFISKIEKLMPPNQPVLVKLIKEGAENGLVVEFFKRSETDNVLFSVNTALSVSTEAEEFENASGDGNNNTSGKLKSVKLQRLISLNQFDDNVPSSGFLSCPPLPKVGNYLDVKIPCAVNPYNFFVQPYASQDKLSKLMATLQERYKDIGHSPLHIDDVLPGKIYASRHEDGVWYRTSVMKVIHHGSISVFYCDFGYYANLTLQQLIPLDPEFMELPHQAIKAKLAGIEPKNSKWTMDDCKFFEKLVCRKSFVSILVAKEMDDLYRYDTLLSLKLIDTSTKADIHIDKTLVTRGIAKYLEN